MSDERTEKELIEMEEIEQRLLDEIRCLDTKQHTEEVNRLFNEFIRQEKKRVDLITAPRDADYEKNVHAQYNEVMESVRLWEKAKEQERLREEGPSSSKTSCSNSFCPENSAPVRAKHDRKEAERIKPFQFKPGVSGNPGGRPKHDLASEIARAIFQNDGPAIYAAFSKMLRKGSPYAFQVLSDRAFGKLRETHQVDLSPYKDMSEEELEARIKQLEQQLGFSAPEELPPDSESKPN